MTELMGRLLLDGALVPGRVTLDGDRMAAIEPDPSVTDERIIAPGFIDLQVNGGFGIDFGEHPDRIGEVAAWLPQTGCTAFLPTIVSSFGDRYRRVFESLPAAFGAPGARVLGLHLEGPFLAPGKKGAHALDAIEAADDALFDELLSEEAVRLVTLAPERRGAFDRIRRLADRGVLVSLGHSEATFEQFEAGIDAGARMATHLFNAMSQLDSRAPGAVGAALVDERVTVGIDCRWDPHPPGKSRTHRTRQRHAWDRARFGHDGRRRHAPRSLFPQRHPGHGRCHLGTARRWSLGRFASSPWMPPFAT